MAPVAPIKGDVEKGLLSGYGVSMAQLNAMNQDKNMDELAKFGGVEGLAKLLDSDTHSGLDAHATSGSHSVTAHKEAFGENKFAEVPPKSFLSLVWDTLHDPILILLVAAATLSTVLGVAIPEERAANHWIEGVAIWFAVILVTCVGAGNDYQKDRQFRKLNAAKDKISVKAVRNGTQLLVDSTDLVVGDIMLLDTGDKLLADGICIDSQGLVLDEASLTGESDPIKKNRDDDPWLRSGTEVSEGSGRMLVVAVGENSEWGKTMLLVGEAGDDATPLQEKLEDVAGAVGKIGFGVAIACFIAMLIKWCVVNNGFPIKEINNNGPVQFFLYAITIIVVAVPEGLPLAVTISLAYSMKKMMKDNNFVRVLAACETMGGATAICSDKTGTLTENRMTVTEGWFAGTKLDHPPSQDELNPELMTELKLNMALNSKAFLVKHEGSDKIDFVGNRTECALLILMQSWGIDYAAVREEYSTNLEKMYGFSSTKKMASCLVRLPNKFRVYNKGAAEWVLARCVSMIDPSGDVVSMSEPAREELLEVVTAMAKRGLRCICLTYTDLPLEDPSRSPDYFENSDNVDKDLICMAIVGIKDPVRKEVPEAVVTCKRAGITVRMVTGDNIHTAKNIAVECGIFDPSTDHVALEGPVFRTMPGPDLQAMLPKLRVLARSSPEDKLTLVSYLKQQGEVVAVTGDGTNDAPALKESDVGLAMGIAGTEVAKEAADIVILDDNFSSIVKSVLWGRSVFNNIRKFLQFQLTVNVAALAVSFVGAVVGGHEPLNVLQLLWVNLIMDTMGALALATEDPNPDLLLQKPNGRDEPLITFCMWKHILIQASYQLFWMFLFLFAAPGNIHRYSIIDDTYWYENNCVQELMEHYDWPAAQAAYTCDIVTWCGFPLHKDYRTTDTCVLRRDFFKSSFPAPYNVVPSDLRKACCDHYTVNGTVTTGEKCDLYKNVSKSQKHLAKQYRKAEDDDWKKTLSILFNSFIMCQLVNEVNARRINDEYDLFVGFLASPIFISVIAITMGFQALIMQTKIGIFFKVEPLDGIEWLVSMAIGSGAMPLSLLTRFISRNIGELNIRGRGVKVHAVNTAGIPATRQGRTLSHERRAGGNGSFKKK